MNKIKAVCNEAEPVFQLTLSSPNALNKMSLPCKLECLSLASLSLFSLMLEPNKLERLSLVSLSSLKGSKLQLIGSILKLRRK